MVDRYFRRNRALRNIYFLWAFGGGVACCCPGCGRQGIMSLVLDPDVWERGLQRLTERRGYGGQNDNQAYHMPAGPSKIGYL